MYQLSWPQDVTYKDYPIQKPFGLSSSSKEIERTGIIHWLLSILIRQRALKRPSFYQTLPNLFEGDSSSVWPHFEIKAETSLMKFFTEKSIPEEMLEYDIVIHIPPKRRYTIELKVNNVRKAEPKIVDPDWSNYD